MKIVKKILIALSVTLFVCCGANNKKAKNNATQQDSMLNNENRPPRPPRHEDHRTPCEALKEGPTGSSEHGPMDNADLNRDGTVLREELEAFMQQGEYRRVTIINFFDLFDTDKNGKLSDTEFTKVNPNHSFNGTDANGDCIVTREEVVAYANEKGRSYRKIGLDKFFDLVDVNGDNKATPEEIEAAHESGLLARF
ncbi:hypothetical protein LG651_09235 [Tamlana sp. 62-3]|uniref:EF-hand domain-containing protein n=1 Tax=Neotamlana sargassicola TaxID=2883125 RepID=A0A9X1I7Q2_9FLAO|nr:hypothetical protein [Tamlana sargassicola]MCB4808435.1 hypothetical protein [Tamlana sargassicola]